LSVYFTFSYLRHVFCVRIDRDFQELAQIQTSHDTTVPTSSPTTPISSEGQRVSVVLVEHTITQSAFLRSYCPHMLFYSARADQFVARHGPGLSDAVTTVFCLPIVLRVPVDIVTMCVQRVWRVV
jgi:hypothetical protein